MQWTSRTKAAKAVGDPKLGNIIRMLTKRPLDRDATSEPEKTFMIVRQPKRGGSFAARSKWRKSNEGHPQPKRDLNAQRNYERYVALARAEELAGNKVGAENYHQFAEHYYRLMSSDHESS